MDCPLEGQPVKRRDFIILIGTAAAGVPLAARAQQSMPAIVGFLGPGTAELVQSLSKRLHTVIVRLS
jgi:hypothetical protein